MTREEKQKVIDAVERLNALKQFIGYDKDSEIVQATQKSLDMAIKALEQEPKWVPVSERLPEDGQIVLFCDIDNDIMVGYHVKGRPSTHFSQDGTYEDMKNVRAWMPLPKPYKAESEG